MIAADQPKKLPAQVFAAVSCLADGVIRHPSLDAAAPANIRSWCSVLNVPLEQTVGLYVTYGDDRSYTDIAEATTTLDAKGASTEKGWMRADALVTNLPDIAVLLPVADCNAVIYADPKRRVVALAHLGWHSTVNNLAAKVVQHMATRYDSNPADIFIYNSPSIRAQSYLFTHLAQTPITTWHTPLYSTPQPDGRYAIDLPAYNYDQWIAAGILPEHIEMSDVDTATSDSYPSHSMEQGSRFAVLTKLHSMVK